MPNQYKNKVIYGDQTLMDITDTTASSEDVLEGEVFYSANGARSVGTLGDATTSTHGLMSASDKTKLDGIAEGATANVGTITGIKMNGANKGTSGVVDLGTVITSHQDISGKLNTSLKGAKNGLAELDANGKVPSSQLPSYVDDVLEYDKQASFPATGEAGKIYIARDTNKTYRWSGTTYVEISASLALGTTSSTAYRGDYGNTAYTHASAKGSAFTSGLYKITTNSEGHVTNAVAVEKSDITALGIPATNTTYTFDGTYNASTNKAATVSTVTNAINALDGGTIGEGSTSKTITALSQTNGNVSATFSDISITKSQVSDLGTIGAAAAKGVDTSIAAASTSTNLPTSKAIAAFVEGKGYKTTDNNTTYTITQDNTDGHKFTLSGSDGSETTITIPDNNTTYSSKTAVSGGTEVSLVTTGEKAIWNAKTTNTGTVTKVSTGVGLTGGDVTTTGTIKAKLKSETAHIADSATPTNTASRQYAVGVDKSGYLSVNVPWTDSKPVTSVAGKTGAVTLAKGDVGLGNVENKSSATIRGELTSSNVTTALGFTPMNANLKGENNGVAELDSNGKVPSSQLPSFVDDVLEYKSSSAFPETGESGKIYIAQDTNKTYRWSGSAYVEISQSLALGETSSTAYRGDRGKTAYDHAAAKGSAFSSGLYKITTNAQGHVTAATAVAKADITALGIPGSDTNTTYSLTQDSTDGHKITLTPSSGSATTITIPDNNNHRPIQVNGTEVLGNNTTALNLKAGNNVSLTNSNGTVTIASSSSNYTNDLVRPNKLNGVVDNTIVPQIDDLRANRLAFLPADQIIIEKTTDGGETWTDAGVSDVVKLGLFSQTRNSISIPLLNGEKNILCGLRVTFTAMKYNVPTGTPETEKYNYWNSNYVQSTERYNQLREMYFWVSSNTDSIKVKLERATGAKPNNWIVLFDRSDYGMTGWSGNDYISFSQDVFGGGTNQTGNYWNYRLTFFTAGKDGSSILSGTNKTSSQSIAEIRGYGTSWWTAGNKFAASDHMYSWDANKNVTFPSKVTANNGFSGNLTGDVTGKINNHTVNSDVPAGAKFTDTTYSDATTSASGLMSATDKTKLNGIAEGATANIGTITGITMNGVSKGTSGVVNLGTVLTTHQNISGKADKVTNATAGNFAGLDANGNLKDSGSKASDFMTRSAVVDLVYPVGSIYMSVASTSPATLFGGTWTQLKDRFLIGTGDTYSNGATGGAASVSYTPAGTNSGGAVGNHTLTVAEIPSHNHSFTGREVSTGNQSAGHTHKYTDYYATTTGSSSLSEAQLASHDHVHAIDHSDGTVISSSEALHINGTAVQLGLFSNLRLRYRSKKAGSGNTHTHSGANTSTTRTSEGASANHTHKVIADGSVGNKGGGASHNHGFTQPTFTGTKATINTMPPYLTVYMWKRTA